MFSEINAIRHYSIVSFIFIILAVATQYLIIEYGHLVAFGTTSLSWEMYGYTLLIGYGIVLWTTMCKWLLRKWEEHNVDSYEKTQYEKLDDQIELVE